MREANKETIKKIREMYEKAGYECKDEFPIVRENKNLKDIKVGKIDICCKKEDIINCFEVEDSQKQALQNERDLKRVKNQYSKKGYNVGVCHLASGENVEEVCK